MIPCCTPVAEALKQNGARPCLTGLHGSTVGFALTQLMHPRSDSSARDPG